MNLPGSPVRFCNCTPRQFSSRSELTVGSKRANLGTSWVRLAAGESVARVSHLHHYGDVVADLATGSVRWERHETPGRLLSSTDSYVPIALSACDGRQHSERRAVFLNVRFRNRSGDPGRLTCAQGSGSSAFGARARLKESPVLADRSSGWFHFTDLLRRTGSKTLVRAATLIASIGANRLLGRYLACASVASREIALLLCAYLVVANLQACGSLPRRDAVPALSTVRAVTPEAPRSRYWPELDMRPMLHDAVESDDRERATLVRTGQPADHLPPANFLAISGGSDLGAFGAGLLVGWTEHGQRPPFKVVTGVSAGALIAPFAFLGPKYDEVLRAVCSSLRPRDIFHARNILTAISSDAFADNSPLAAIIAKYVTAEVLASIAREHAQGRLLLIGTTNLDARQPVVWNMGQIASSPDPRALDLFRKVMLASTAIPGIFPPVMIDVEVDGKRYQEMHVDGGVTTQVFLAPPNLVQELNNPTGSYARERHVYVIRNGRVEPHWLPVERRTTQVARRALETLIYEQGVNDLYRLEVAAEREGEDFNVAYIDANFNYPHPTAFAPDFVRQLFQYSNSLAARGYPWRKTLPHQLRPAND